MSRDGVVIMMRTRYETDEIISVAQELGIRFEGESFTLEDFREGMEVELVYFHEHPEACKSDPVALGAIVLQHLREAPCYYLHLLGGSAS